MKKKFFIRVILIVFFVLLMLLMGFFQRNRLVNLIVKPIVEQRISGFLGFNVRIKRMAGGLSEGLIFYNVTLEGENKKFKILFNAEKLNSNLKPLDFFIPSSKSQNVLNILSPTLSLRELPKHEESAEHEIQIVSGLIKKSIFQGFNVTSNVENGEIAYFYENGELRGRLVHINGFVGSNNQGVSMFEFTGSHVKGRGSGAVLASGHIDVFLNTSDVDFKVENFLFSGAPRLFGYLEFDSGKLDADFKMENAKIKSGYYVVNGVSGKFLEGKERFNGVSGKISFDTDKITVHNMAGSIRGGDFNLDGSITRGDIVIVDGSAVMKKGNAVSSVSFKGPVNGLSIKGFHGGSLNDEFTENFSFSLVAHSAELTDNGLKIMADEGVFLLGNGGKADLSGIILAEMGHITLQSLNAMENLLIEGNIYFAEQPEIDLKVDFNETKIEDIKNLLRPDLKKSWFDDIPVSGIVTLKGHTEQWEMNGDIKLISRFDKMRIKGSAYAQDGKVKIEKITIDDKLEIKGYWGFRPDESFSIEFISKPVKFSEYKLFFNPGSRNFFDDTTIEGNGKIYGKRDNWNAEGKYTAKLENGVAGIVLDVKDHNIKVTLSIDDLKYHSIPVKTQLDITGYLKAEEESKGHYIDDMKVESTFLKIGPLIFDDVVGNGRVKEGRVTMDSLSIDKYIKLTGYFDFNIPAKMDMLFEIDGFELASIRKLATEPSGVIYGGVVSGDIHLTGSPSYIYTKGKLSIRDGYAGKNKIEDVYVNLDGAGSIIDLPNSTALINDRKTKIVGSVNLEEGNIFNKIEFELPERKVSWHNRDASLNIWEQ